MNRFIAGLVALVACLQANALEPKDVYLLVNKNMPESREVAEHYCQKRGVPVENIISLDLPKTEDISRDEYSAKIVAPIREALTDKKEKAKVLLSIYGVPLRVGPQLPNAAEQEEIKKLDPQIRDLQAAVAQWQAVVATQDAFKKTVPLILSMPTPNDNRRQLLTSQQELNAVNIRRGQLNYPESQACVDSELMMLWWDNYDLRRFRVNAMHWQIPAKAREGNPPQVMTCRLDGPSVAVVKRLVDDAIAVEKKGLDGKVYVDARGIRFNPKNEDGYGYAGYDESMREMAALLEKEGKMTVVLDDKGELFKPDSCPDCALYCGWYSLANFVDCCRFVPGAVAWHLASSEAVSLRQPNTKYWCKNQLEKGAAATLGPVAEPYTIGFPKPAEFFGFLATGKYTLVEAYSRTVLMTSWMTVLVGDPLYNPFAKNPRLKEEQVVPSPKGGKPFFNVK